MTQSTEPRHTPMLLIHMAGFGELRSGKPEAIDDVSLAGQGTSAHFCRVEDWKTQFGKDHISMILRAVNSHEELLEALKRLMLAFYSDAQSAPEMTVQMSWETNTQAIETAQKAITKAEGKS